VVAVAAITTNVQQLHAATGACPAKASRCLGANAETGKLSREEVHYIHGVYGYVNEKVFDVCEPVFCLFQSALWEAACSSERLSLKGMRNQRGWFDAKL
jgi:hypothetical protein